MAVLRINAKSCTGEEGCTTLLGHLGSGPRSFLLPPLPPLIFRDVAKAEEEGSPFGGGGVLFLVKAPSSVCNEF